MPAKASTMRAIVYDRYGPPEVLQLEELPRPEPGDDDVLIRVRAAEATKSDCEMRSFRYSVKWFWLPMRLAMGVRRPRRRVLGMYFAGEIEAVGANVRGFQVGDAVFGCTSMGRGAYAEYLRVPGRVPMVAKPKALTFAEAAAVPLGGLNALHFMQRGKIQPGERVLVNGAGGSIGAHGVQIAKSMGAHVTAVDCARKAAVIKAFGADRFIDYEREDFAAGKDRYDVIFDMVPSTSVSRCMKLLKPGGRYLNGNPRLMTMVRCAWINRFSNKTAVFAFAPETRDALRQLAALAEAGDLRSIVDTVYPMTEAVTAHQRVEAEDRLGAIVIEMST